MQDIARQSALPGFRRRPARRALMRSMYAEALYKADDAMLDDIREAVATLEETERTARRVLGGTHPDTASIEEDLQKARAVLRARETPPPGSA